MSVLSSRIRFILPAGAVLLSLALQSMSAFAGTLAGTWEFKYEINDRQVTADVEFTETEEGAMAATWSPQWPDDDSQLNFDPSKITFEVSDIKLEDDAVSFRRQMDSPDWNLESDFSGTLDGDKLTGVFSSDWGDIDVTATRPAHVASGIFGAWELTTKGRNGTLRTRVLTLNEDLTGTYEGRNNDSPIQDVTREGNGFGFKIVRERQGGDTFTMEFKGTVDGDALNGEFVTSRGTRPVTGKRVDAGAM